MRTADDPGADRRAHGLDRQCFGDAVLLADAAEPGYCDDEHVDVAFIEACEPGVDVAARPPAPIAKAAGSVEQDHDRAGLGVDLISYEEPVGEPKGPVA
ncbi:hypothetical protein ACQP1G_15915 [Nocardia sp. CA-107356]|uniref:hypothetical protein n=1 Tax=Nocardia sp. CA-107356 TaxID=3239972 RepID=UPI003D8A8558